MSTYRNRLFKIIFAFLLIFLFSANKTYAQETIPYISEETETLTMSEIDEISSYGEQLSLKGIDLILQTKSQNNRTGNEECKNIFYSHVKKNNSENKIIVIIYYTEENEFEFYDDYGIMSKKTLENVFNYLKKFNVNGQINNGITFAYRTIAKELNSEFDLNIDILNQLSIENPYKRSIFSIKNFIGILIVGVLLVGFRRNKDINII